MDNTDIEGGVSDKELIDMMRKKMDEMTKVTNDMREELNYLKSRSPPEESLYGCIISTLLAAVVIWVLFSSGFMAIWTCEFAHVDLNICRVVGKKIEDVAKPSLTFVAILIVRHFIPTNYDYLFKIVVGIVAIVSGSFYIVLKNSSDNVNLIIPTAAMALFWILEYLVLNKLYYSRITSFSMFYYCNFLKKYSSLKTTDK